MFNGCHFCAIAQGVEPRELIHKTEYVIAFTPTAPIAKGHIILIPKHHIPSIFEMTYRDLLDISTVIDDLKKLFFDAPGLTIVTTSKGHDMGYDGPFNYQNHLQWHMIPTLDESLVGPWGDK